MNEMNNQTLHQALNQATTSWHVQNFVVLTKDSKQQIDASEGLLRKGSGEGVTVKLYTIQMLESDPEKMAPKINKWMQQGRLGGTTEDGRVLFHEEVAKRLADIQTFIIRSGGTEAAEVFEGTVEGISSEIYQVLAAALAILAEQLNDKSEIKGEKGKQPSAATEAPRARTSGRAGAPVISTAKSPLTNELKSQILQRAIEQERSAEKARQDKAAKEERERKELKQKIIKAENLKEDLSKAAIKQDEIKSGDLKSDIKYAS